MRTKMLAAYVFAAICLALISCNWFSKKNVTPSLIGTWKVIAITDSSVDGLRGNSWFTGYNADSMAAFVKFISDSTLTVIFSKDSVAKDTSLYHIDMAKHAIYARSLKGEGIDTSRIKELNDTILKVTADSVYFTLRKQP